MILGNSAFPLKPWMCIPFGYVVLTEKKHYFNYHLSNARKVPGGAFGKLKSQVRVFHRKCKSSKESIKAMCLAAIVLKWEIFFLGAWI